MIFLQSILVIDNESDRHFMERLYSSNYRLMFQIARKYTQSKENAEDFVNEACMKLIRNIKKLRDKDDCIIQQYIAVTIKSIAIDHHRKKNRQLYEETMYDPHDETIQTQPSEDATPEEAFIEMSQLENLIAALGGLSATQHRLLELKHLHGYSNEDIVKIMGFKNTDNVRANLSKAHVKARKLLNKRKELIMDA